jgi:hypothetical protein
VGQLGQGQVGMDLVGDDEQVVALGQLAERRQFGLAQHAPGRVVRVHEQEDLCFTGCSGSSVQVEGPIGLAGHGLHGDEAAPHLFQSSHEAGVRRCEQQHPVPRRAGELDQDADCLDRVRQDP